MSQGELGAVENRIDIQPLSRLLIIVDIPAMSAIILSFTYVAFSFGVLVAIFSLISIASDSWYGPIIAALAKFGGSIAELFLIVLLYLLLRKLRSDRIKRPRVLWAALLGAVLVNILVIVCIVRYSAGSFIIGGSIQCILLLVYPYLMCSVHGIRKQALLELDRGQRPEFYDLLSDAPQTAVVPSHELANSNHGDQETS